MAYSRRPTERRRSIALGPLHRVTMRKWSDGTHRCSSSPRRNQDMSLAGSVVMVLSSLTVIGTLISDILLVAIDPRIREAV